MSDWISLRVNTKDLEKKEENYSISPSPYDIPEAIKAEYDKSKNRLHIQFKYISEEPLKRRDDRTGVSFGMGRNSQRLYEVDVDMEKVIGPLADLIVGKIKNLAAEYAQRRDNYIMAERAISSEKDGLLATLPPEAKSSVES